MKVIQLILVCITLHLTNEATAQKSIWKTLLAPDNPPLQKVRNVEEARRLDGLTVLDFIGLVRQYSYPAEEHKLTTEDGYHLTFHRIPDSPQAKKTNEDKKIVFLQHGLFGSSDMWVLLGPGRDLALLLADAGYDVWIGNIRGNTYCRSHEKLSTSDRDFWEFSFHEAALYDISSMLDYILNHTGKEKLYYIGHSMGTTMSYILLSMKPEYNEKINLAISLAPVGSWTHGASPFVNFLAQNKAKILEFLDKNDIRDILAQSVTNIVLLKSICNDLSPFHEICILLSHIVGGQSRGQADLSAMLTFLSYIPAGTSVHLLDHFLQNIDTRNFRAYDYGAEGNYLRYKQKTPPAYDYKRITAPFYLIYGRADALALPPNVMEVYKHLPDARLEEIPNPKFNHFDFYIGKDAKSLLYDRIIEILDTF